MAASGTGIIGLYAEVSNWLKHPDLLGDVANQDTVIIPRVRGHVTQVLNKVTAGQRDAVLKPRGGDSPYPNALMLLAVLSRFLVPSASEKLVKIILSMKKALEGSYASSTGPSLHQLLEQLDERSNCIAHHAVKAGSVRLLNEFAKAHPTLMLMEDMDGLLPVHVLSITCGTTQAQMVIALTDDALAGAYTDPASAAMQRLAYLRTLLDCRLRAIASLLHDSPGLCAPPGKLEEIQRARLVAGFVADKCVERRECMSREAAEELAAELPRHRVHPKVSSVDDTRSVGPEHAEARAPVDVEHNTMDTAIAGIQLACALRLRYAAASFSCTQLPPSSPLGEAPSGSAAAAHKMSAHTTTPRAAAAGDAGAMSFQLHIRVAAESTIKAAWQWAEDALKGDPTAMQDALRWQDKQGWTHVAAAARASNAAAIRFLLALDSTLLDAKDYAGFTPLQRAANHGAHPCVELLLNRSDAGGVYPAGTLRIAWTSALQPLLMADRDPSEPTQHRVAVLHMLLQRASRIDPDIASSWLAAYMQPRGDRTLLRALVCAIAASPAGSPSIAEGAAGDISRDLRSMNVHYLVVRPPEPFIHVVVLSGTAEMLDDLLRDCTPQRRGELLRQGSRGSNALGRLLATFRDIRAEQCNTAMLAALLQHAHGDDAPGVYEHVRDLLGLFADGKLGSPDLAAPLRLLFVDPAVRAHIASELMRASSPDAGRRVKAVLDRLVRLLGKTGFRQLVGAKSHDGDAQVPLVLAVATAAGVCEVREELLDLVIAHGGNVDDAEPTTNETALMRCVDAADVAGCTALVCRGASALRPGGSADTASTLSAIERAANLASHDADRAMALLDVLLHARDVKTAARDSDSDPPSVVRRAFVLAHCGGAPAVTERLNDNFPALHRLRLRLQCRRDPLHGITVEEALRIIPDAMESVFWLPVEEAKATKATKRLERWLAEVDTLHQDAAAGRQLDAQQREKLANAPLKRGEFERWKQLLAQLTQLRQGDDESATVLAHSEDSLSITTPADARLASCSPLDATAPAPPVVMPRPAEFSGTGGAAARPPTAGSSSALAASAASPPGWTGRASSLLDQMEALVENLEAAVRESGDVSKVLTTHALLGTQLLADAEEFGPAPWQTTLSSVLRRVKRNGEILVIKEPLHLLPDAVLPTLRELLLNMRLMGGFKHDNVTLMTGFAISRKELPGGTVVPVVSLAFPYFPLGSLRSWLDEHGDGWPSLATKWSILYDVARGMNAINEMAMARGQRIVHRDLHSGNVLLHAAPGAIGTFGGTRMPPDTTPVAKIHDFGFAKLFDHTAHMTASHVSTAGVAPETLGGAPAGGSGGVYNEKVDIYHYGSLLFEVLSGKKAFGARTPEQIITLTVGRMKEIDDMHLQVREAMDVDGKDEVTARRDVARTTCRRRLYRELGRPPTPAECDRLVAACLAQSGDYSSFTLPRDFLTRAEVLAAPCNVPLREHALVLQLLNLMDACLDFNPSRRPANFKVISEELLRLKPAMPLPSFMHPTAFVREIEELAQHLECADSVGAGTPAFHMYQCIVSLGTQKAVLGVDDSGMVLPWQLHGKLAEMRAWLTIHKPEHAGPLQQTSVLALVRLINNYVKHRNAVYGASLTKDALARDIWTHYCSLFDKLWPLTGML